MISSRRKFLLVVLSIVIALAAAYIFMLKAYGYPMRIRVVNDSSWELNDISISLNDKAVLSGNLQPKREIAAWNLTPNCKSELVLKFIMPKDNGIKKHTGIITNTLRFAATTIIINENGNVEFSDFSF